MNLTLTPTDELIEMIRNVVRQELQALPTLKSHEAPLNKKGLSEYLDISISSLEKLMKSGKIKYFTIGNQPRFTWDEIEAYQKR